MHFHRGRLIDHVRLRAKDLDAAKRFRRAVLAALGHADAVREGPALFSAGEPWTDAADGPASRVHPAFRAGDRTQVGAFHEAARAAGGTSGGPPGEREYHPGYHLTFAPDPDGASVGAVFHGRVVRSAASAVATPVAGAGPNPASRAGVEPSRSTVAPEPGAPATSSSHTRPTPRSMASLAHHLYTMACNNAWANHRLHAACAKLGPEAFAAKRASFFPSIKATLNHIITVDWYYLDALERAYRNESPNREAGRFFDPEEPFDTLGALSIEQHATDRRLIALCAGLTEADVDRPVPVVRRSSVEMESATRLLAHLFQHQIHHRGQVHAMLTDAAVPPPQLDEFFCANEATLREAELAEIGLSEAAIWEPR